MLRVRLGDERPAAELRAYLRARGFLVVEGEPTEFRIHLRNHVSDRFDRIAARSALACWSRTHRGVTLEEVT